MQKSMESSQVQTLVKDRHLKPGELKELLDFLWELESIRRREFELSRFPENLVERICRQGERESYMNLIAERMVETEREIEEGTQEIFQYRKRSTYGRTDEDIIQTAREHVLNCPDCLAQYKKEIQRRAYKTTSLIHSISDKAFPEIEHRDSFKETFENLTLKRDSLCIFSQE